MRVQWISRLPRHLTSKNWGAPFSSSQWVLRSILKWTFLCVWLHETYLIASDACSRTLLDIFAFQNIRGSEIYKIAHKRLCKLVSVSRRRVSSNLHKRTMLFRVDQSAHCKGEKGRTKFFGDIEISLQGDHSGCVKPPVDIKIEVLF